MLRTCVALIGLIRTVPSGRFPPLPLGGVVATLTLAYLVLQIDDVGRITLNYSRDVGPKFFLCMNDVCKCVKFVVLVSSGVCSFRFVILLKAKQQLVFVDWL